LSSNKTGPAGSGLFVLVNSPNSEVVIGLRTTGWSALLPGGCAGRAAIQRRLRLDEPLGQQYLDWLWLGKQVAWRRGGRPELATMLETMGADHVTAARARGLPESILPPAMAIIPFCSASILWVERWTRC